MNFRTLIMLAVAVLILVIALKINRGDEAAIEMATTTTTEEYAAEAEVAATAEEAAEAFSTDVVNEINEEPQEPVHGEPIEPVTGDPAAPTAEPELDTTGSETPSDAVSEIIAPENGDVPAMEETVPADKISDEPVTVD